MDTIEQMHSDIRMLVPESDGRYFSPEEIDSAVNASILDLFNQQYKIFEESQRITDQMSRFKITSTVPVSVGIGPLPTGLIYTLNITASKVSGVVVTKKVRIVQEQFISQYIDSEAFAPDDSNIIARVLGTNIQVYPSNVTEIRVTHFRIPAKAKFNYTLTGILGTVIVYNPSGSIQLDYSPASYNQILEKALRWLGIAQKDQTLIQNEQIARANNQPEAR